MTWEIIQLNNIKIEINIKTLRNLLIILRQMTHNDIYSFGLDEEQVVDIKKLSDTLLATYNKEKKFVTQN